MLNNLVFASKSNVDIRKFSDLRPGSIFSFLEQPQGLMIKTESGEGVSLIAGSTIELNERLLVNYFSNVDINVNTIAPDPVYPEEEEINNG